MMKKVILQKVILQKSDLTLLFLFEVILPYKNAHVEQSMRRAVDGSLSCRCVLAIWDVSQYQ